MLFWNLRISRKATVPAAQSATWQSALDARRKRCGRLTATTPFLPLPPPALPPEVFWIQCQLRIQTPRSAAGRSRLPRDVDDECLSAPELSASHCSR